MANPLADPDPDPDSDPDATLPAPGPRRVAAPALCWRVVSGAATPGPRAAVVGTGHAGLDAALPGGGWMAGLAHEVGLAHPGGGEWALLAPGLVRVLGLQAQRCHAVCMGAPAQPLGPSLQSCGLDLARWAWVDAPGTLARAWAAEQALRCPQVAVVLLWLDQAPAPMLRRLQFHAQAHGAWLFICRGVDALAQPSPAAVRLSWLPTPDACAFEARLTKCRGPLPARAIRVPRSSAPWQGAAWAPDLQGFNPYVVDGLAQAA
jgi:protein ImuA